MNWYYSDGKGRVGPFGEDALRDLIARRIITAETLVWGEGMEDWQKVEKVADLAKALPATLYHERFTHDTPSTPPAHPPTTAPAAPQNAAVTAAAAASTLNAPSHMGAPTMQDGQGIPKQEGVLTFAIITTVVSVLSATAVCLTILAVIPGIVAIVHATKIPSLVAAGQVDAAWQAARSSKKWSWISVITIVSIFVLGIILLILFAILSASASM